MAKKLTKHVDWEMTAEDFIALSDDQKERIWRELDAKSPEQLLAESRPLNAKERAQWRTLKRRIGRPKVGKGVKVISLSVEKDLLKRADSHAKRLGISRAQLFSRGLEAVLGSAA
jgi:hypothetical protein